MEHGPAIFTIAPLGKVADPDTVIVIKAVPNTPAKATQAGAVPKPLGSAFRVSDDPSFVSPYKSIEIECASSNITFTAALRSAGRPFAVGWAKQEFAAAVAAVELVAVGARRFAVVRRPTVVVAPQANRCFDCWIGASRRKGWLALAMRNPRRGGDAIDDWG